MTLPVTACCAPAGCCVASGAWLVHAALGIRMRRWIGLRGIGWLIASRRRRRRAVAAAKNVAGDAGQDCGYFSPAQHFVESQEQNGQDDKHDRRSLQLQASPQVGQEVQVGLVSAACRDGPATRRSREAVMSSAATMVSPRPSGRLGGEVRSALERDGPTPP